MANSFSAAGSDDLKLSNGATDVFLDVLTLAGCALAETPWECHLVLSFADGHRWSRGTAGFDLGDLPWTAEWPAEKAFLERVVELSLTRHGWGRLSYDPPYALISLTRFREMVTGFTPAPTARDDWRVAPELALVARCERHDLFTGVCGCRLCDPDIQPS